MSDSNIFDIHTYKKYLDKLYDQNNIDFKSVDKNQFLNKFAPFVHMVNLWSNILSMVLIKCPNHSNRKYIIKNLYEENCLDLTHVDTFCKFLDEINIFNNQSDHDILNIQSNHIIEHYKSELINFVSDPNNDFDSCCQVLGAIEYVYHMISAHIVDFVNTNYGFIPKYHYSVHEILDIQHADELFFSISSDPHIKKTNIDIGAYWIINIIKKLIETDL